MEKDQGRGHGRRHLRDRQDVDWRRVTTAKEACRLGEGGAAETCKGLHLLPLFSSRFYQILRSLITRVPMFSSRKKNMHAQFILCVYFHSAKLSKHRHLVIRPPRKPKPSRPKPQFSRNTHGVLLSHLPVLVDRLQTVASTFSFSCWWWICWTHHSISSLEARCETRGGHPLVPWSRWCPPRSLVFWPLPLSSCWA